MRSEHPSRDRVVELVDKARRLGPLPYSALGRRGQWRPEPSIELVEWMTESLDQWWISAGQPDPYTVVDVGAGEGALAREVLAAGPQCLSALRYVLVEPDGLGPDLAARAVTHGRTLPIEAPSLLFPPGLDDPDDPEDTPQPAQGIGPLITSLAELPRLGGFAVVVAIGWLDRLPIDVLEWHDGDWWEVRLVAEHDRLVEMRVPFAARIGLSGLLDAWSSGDRPSEGDRYSISVGATEWLSDALRCAESGLLVVCGEWTEVTRANANPAELGLDQMSRVHHPLPGGPRRLAFSESAVTWRLG